jgi:hypothetical protein
MKLTTTAIIGIAGIVIMCAAGRFDARRLDAGFAQQAYVKGSNTDLNDLFGYSAAIDGDTAVVGAQAQGNGAGAAYVFVRGGGSWTQQASIKPSDAATQLAAQFGQAVAISGNTIVVGAPNHGPGGAAFVFVRNPATGAWTEQQRIKIPPPTPNGTAFDSFGVSVGISGDTIVVGAYAEDSNATGVNGDQANNLALESGAAYVYVRSGTVWTQQAYLKASNTEQGDNFGWSVGISGETVVVGAFREASNATGVNGLQSNNLAFQSGAVYVFQRSGTAWTQQAYLKASNTGIGDTFGYAVAISNDTIVVGARIEASSATGVDGNQFDNGAGAAGAAYVFVRDGDSWTQQAYLTASNTQVGAGDQFGHAVSISGNVIVVGATEEDGGASGVNGDQTDNSVTGAGAAYVFVRGGHTWSQHSYLKASNPAFDNSFGYAVGVSGSTVISGALNESTAGTHAGAAYIFHLPNTAPTVNGAAISRWADTTGSFILASATDAEDGSALLDLAIVGANPSNGVTLMNVSQADGRLSADVIAGPGASSATFEVSATDVWGATGSGTFTVTIVPRVLITPFVDPAPNANGWHNVPATVHFVVENAALPICEEYVRIDFDTDGRELRCTASNAGGTASAFVTVRVDRTPPVGTASRTPGANANGWNSSDVTVAFTCADTLSGEVSPGATHVVGTEGAGQSRAFACADLAGNVVPLAVTGINIDKTAPAVAAGTVAASPNPVMVNNAVALTANLTDAGSGGLARAEVRIGAGAYGLLSAASGAAASVTGPIGPVAEPSVVDACVRAVDVAGNQSAEECTLIAVFDPTAGYVTGAGTIDSPVGALVGSTAAGTARFGFQSKYARGATVPSGSTQFRFRAGDLDFDSTAYEWLVVAGARAQYKGTGTLRGRSGTFEFLLTVIDGDQAGGGGVDKFRIKISGASGLVYDNQIGSADNTDPSTAIAGGHIVIRR